MQGGGDGGDTRISYLSWSNYPAEVLQHFVYFSVKKVKGKEKRTKCWINSMGHAAFLEDMDRWDFAFFNNLSVTLFANQYTLF